MENPELILRTDPTPAEIDELENHIYDFNARTTGIDDALALAIFGHDAGGRVIAGLCGHTWGGCCEIRQVWVHETLRGQGIGGRLLRLAESEARRRGCFQIILATHSFQALGFYRRLGFEVVATIPDYPRGHQDVHLRKILTEDEREDDPMKRAVILPIASLLSILLLTLHVTDDIVRGISKAQPSNIALLVLAVLLYGTLVLAERRSGHVIMLFVGVFAAAMPVIHMRGAHYGEIARSTGGFFFVWTLWALGGLGGLTIILSARGLWDLRRRRPR